MSCQPELLAQVPLFSLLDAEERGVLAAHVEMRQFDRNQVIYRGGDAGGRAYVLIEGRARVTLVDVDQQEVVVDEPGPGGFFGFASLLDGTPHQTRAVAMEPATCIEIDHEDLRQLLHKKPDAGLDILAMLGKHFHSAQHLVQTRSFRSANEMIEDRATTGDRLAGAVARFGGSWRFIILFGCVLIVYAVVNVLLSTRAWDPYPFILLNLFLSMLAAIQAPVSLPASPWASLPKQFCPGVIQLAT